MIDNSHNGTSVDIRSSFDRALRRSCVLVLLAAIACGAAIAPHALADRTLTTCSAGGAGGTGGSALGGAVANTGTLSVNGATFTSNKVRPDLEAPVRAAAEAATAGSERNAASAAVAATEEAVRRVRARVEQRQTEATAEPADPGARAAAQAEAEPAAPRPAAGSTARLP